MQDARVVHSLLKITARNKRSGGQKNFLLTFPMLGKKTDGHEIRFLPLLHAVDERVITSAEGFTLTFKSKLP